MKKKKRTALVFFAASLILLLVLLLVTGVLQAYVVLPLLRLFGIITTFINLLPQPILWAIFLATSLLIAFRTLAIGSLRPQSTGTGRGDSPGRVTDLSIWVEKARRDFMRRHLIRHLLDITLQAYGQEKLTWWQAARLLERNDLDLPEGVRNSLLHGLEHNGIPANSNRNPITALIRRVRRPNGRTTDQAQYTDIEDIVVHLENKLGISHGDRV
nr:hypothetical protein [Anaerolineae bacterium]